MTNDADPPDQPFPAPPRDGSSLERIQCPNCCRLAFVTSRSMGLLFYRCELCETVGAAPDPGQSDGAR